jgi:hypothetical protein
MTAIQFVNNVFTVEGLGEVKPGHIVNEGMFIDYIKEKANPDTDQ